LGRWHRKRDYGPLYTKSLEGDRKGASTSGPEKRRTRKAESKNGRREGGVNRGEPVAEAAGEVQEKDDRVTKKSQFEGKKGKKWGKKSVHFGEKTGSRERCQSRQSEFRGTPGGKGSSTKKQQP